MGTKWNTPTRESRMGEETGAIGRRVERAALARAPKATNKESQTVLITLLSCRI